MDSSRSRSRDVHQRLNVSSNPWQDHASQHRMLELALHLQVQRVSLGAQDNPRHPRRKVVGGREGERG
jgi:hypothetical protein